MLRVDEKTRALAERLGPFLYLAPNRIGWGFFLDKNLNGSMGVLGRDCLIGFSPGTPRRETSKAFLVCNGVRRRAVYATYRMSIDPRAKQAVSRPSDDRKKRWQYEVRLFQVLCAIYETSTLWCVLTCME